MSIQSAIGPDPRRNAHNFAAGRQRWLRKGAQQLVRAMLSARSGMWLKDLSMNDCLCIPRQRSSAENCASIREVVLHWEKELKYDCQKMFTYWIAIAPNAYAA
ncbi:hypothetical protein SK355_11495 [Candidatus Fukatsuia symbiotica]|uniref:Uncharacterized protein n=1 Tax=Candidatus Fukatsuia symbiotica TaxID=1878942 RepID=A0A2U8I3Z8_9GAMM|nr:hypothetical protein [Candidatus Fukatsuia symbiotica]AWK13866.1 hypothetical protein CCS41_04275 [Candidatus Fukatsuia symbiotica]MEA9445805.1 hypothetical protein [Candidatus Fukatsuia symbiotica]